ncbi:MAG: sulfotransferase family protein [Planctomycetota bacterium]
MSLKLVGAGLPRTGTMSLKLALEKVLGAPCCHMTAIPGFPFNLGADWNLAIDGGRPDWKKVMAPYHAAVDWPASLFWDDLHRTFPDAVVLLSERTSADVWFDSLDSTILRVMKQPLPPHITVTSPPSRMFERFAGKKEWHEPALLKDCYHRHNEQVRKVVPKDRLVEWRPGDGWAPICNALKIPVPAEPFPHVNRREEWLTERGTPTLPPA